MKPILRFRKVDEERFEEVRNGLKVIETRAATKKYENLKVGDVVVFVCGNDRFERRVKKKYNFSSVDEMVGKVPFKKVMPSVNSIEEMKKVYSSYPRYDEKIKQCGLVGFEFE